MARDSKDCEGDVNRLCVIDSIKKKEPEADVAKQEESKEAPKAEVDFVVDQNYDWYQNATHVFISLKVKKGDLRNSLEVSLGQDHINLAAEGRDILDLKLSNFIISAQSTHTVNTKKIELKLKKDADNFNWTSLVRTTDAAPNKVNAVQAAPINNKVLSYPSSSKKKVDMAEMEKAAKQELKDYKEEDGLNDLFKQIYGRADENTRRAMIKSY